MIKNKFIDAFMKTAETFANLSSATRAKVGAIIVKDNRIISIGYNGMPSGWDNTCEIEESWHDVPHMRNKYEEMGATYNPSTNRWSILKSRPEVLHAETNAIAKVAQSSESCKDAIMFCTHLPCIQCAKLIHQSGIKTVYFKTDYKAAIGSGRDFLESSGIEIIKVDESNIPQTVV